LRFNFHLFPVLEGFFLGQRIGVHRISQRVEDRAMSFKDLDGIGEWYQFSPQSWPSFPAVFVLHRLERRRTEFSSTALNITDEPFKFDMTLENPAKGLLTKSSYLTFSA
jgi:hypothetical protein